MQKLVSSAAIEPCGIDYTLPFMSEDQQLQDVMQNMKKTQLFAKEKIVWNAVKPSSSMYIVRSGILKLRVRCNKIQALELLYPGAMYGGITHMPSGDIEYEVAAIETSIVCEIDQVCFAELQKSEFLKYYMAAMSLYASFIRGEYSMLTELNLKTRLARALYKDFTRRGRPHEGVLRVTKILSQEEWALLLRARRETVSRALSELEREGIVKEEDGHFYLLDQESLIRTVQLSLR